MYPIGHPPPSFRGGGPIRGLERIIWPQGQWEAKKKLHFTQWRRHTDIQTDMATLWLNRPNGANSLKKIKALCNSPRNIAEVLIKADFLFLNLQYPQKSISHVICDMCHVTLDTWHMTGDRWEKVNLISKCQLPSCYGLGGKGDMWHLTWDTWHMTCDMRHIKCVTWHTGGDEHCVKYSGPKLLWFGCYGVLKILNKRINDLIN